MRGMTSCSPPVVSMIRTVIDRVILVAPPRVAAAPRIAYVGSDIGSVDPATRINPDIDVFSDTNPHSEQNSSRCISAEVQGIYVRLQTEHCCWKCVPAYAVMAIIARPYSRPIAAPRVRLGTNSPLGAPTP
jgi:hypothetical protein